MRRSLNIAGRCLVILVYLVLRVASLSSERWSNSGQKPLSAENNPPGGGSRAKLIANGTVISFNDSQQQLEVLQNASILVLGDTIVAIFKATDTIRLPRGTEIIPAEGKIVTPGFINIHQHLWQSQYKTIGSNTTLAQYVFLFSEFSQAQTVFTADDIYYGELEGIYESLNAGVTTIVDHASHTWSTSKSLAGLRASIDSGARIHWCFAFHNLTNGYTRAQQYRDFQKIAGHSEGLPRDWKGVRLGIAYDGFSSDWPGEIQKVLHLARKYNVSVLTTHHVGGAWGLNNSPTLVNSFNFLKDTIPVIFAHGSFMTTEDAQLLRSTNQYLAITPESEMNYAQTHPQSHLIQDQAGLAADGASGFSADMITQARIWLQLTRLQLFGQVLQNWQVPRTSPMSVNQAFLLATRSGGLALRRPDLGVLVPGAKADIVVFDGDSPGMLGWSDPVAAVIMHANPGDVRHVLVGGQFRKRDGKLVTSRGQESWATIKRKFLESAQRIQAVWESTPVPNLEGVYTSGFPYADPYQVDVLRGNATGY